MIDKKEDMMKTKEILSGLAMLAVFAGCEKTTFTEDRERADDGVKVYSFHAAASDPVTRAHFNEADAPSRFIYWDEGDLFDFHDITMAADGRETVEVASGKPLAVSASGRSLLFGRKAHDCMLVSYPKGAVTLVDSLYVATWVSASQTDRDTLAVNTTVKVNVPREQVLSSTLTPAGIPIVSSRLALSDKAKAAVAAGTDKVSVELSDPVKLYPLAGLVKMTLKNLPGVASAKIDKVNILSVFGGKTSTGMPQRGLRGDTYISLKDTMPIAGNFVSGDTRYDLTLAGGTVDYTSGDGATVCFVANHSEYPMKQLQVTVYTTDGAMYKKTFAMGDRQIGFAKSHVTSFSLNFAEGTVIKASETRFSVEWSQGYLVYDAGNGAYKIGDRQDIGLYFKFGTRDAIAFYDSNEDWLARIKPSNTHSVPIPGSSGSQQITEDGQTMANGTDNFYNGYSALAAAWRNHPFYTAGDGMVTAGVMTSEHVYHAWSGSTSWPEENDPCARVKVASGEKAWRLPTEAEISNLIEVGAAGVEFGNFDGSDIRSSDGKSRYVKYSDGEQEFYLMANGYVDQKFSKNYSSIQMMFGQKYGVFFFSNAYEGTEMPQTGGKNVASGYGISLSSSPGVTTRASLNKFMANGKNNYSGSHTMWQAANVRCVREK